MTRNLWKRVDTGGNIEADYRFYRAWWDNDLTNYNNPKTNFKDMTKRTITEEYKNGMLVKKTIIEE